MDANTKDVPATDFGNMIGPIGWLEPPHGAFRVNPDFHLSLPPKSLAWSIPVFLGTDKQNQCGETCERAKLCAICARELAPSPDSTDELLDALRRVMRHIPADAGGASLSDDMHRARNAIAAATKD